jgi:hypothetical protein
MMLLKNLVHHSKAIGDAHMESVFDDLMNARGRGFDRIG